MTLRDDETQPEKQHPEPPDVGAVRAQRLVGNRSAEVADTGDGDHNQLSVHSVLQSVLIGCQCAFWFAAIFVLIEARTLVRNLDARTEQVAANGYHLTQATQKTLSDADAMFTSDDIQGTLANITVLTRHAERSLALADDVSVAARKSADMSVDTQQAALVLLNRTSDRLNGDDGVLVQFRNLLATLNFQSTALAHDSQQLIQTITTLAADPNLKKSLDNIEKGTGAFAAAGTSVQQILYDIQHPERPGPFVRGVGIMLQILGVTSKAAQSAPIFGR